MYVRTTSRRSKDGTAVRYLQLAHNEWDAAAGMSRPKILFSFGREDALDRAAVERLVASLARLLDPAAAAALTCPDGLAVTGSRPLGGTHILDVLWRRLRIDAAMRGQLAGRKLDPRAERVLFALAANRALAPSSKLAAAEWITSDVHIDGLEEISDEACYRAMDWLLQIEPKIAEQVYFQVTDLLNLEVDLLFFDTTSTYFELDEADEPIGRDERGHVAEGGGAVKEAGFRTHGKSKDSRDDLPQVSSGWRSPATGSRCGSGPGPGTPATPT